LSFNFAGLFSLDPLSNCREYETRISFKTIIEIKNIHLFVAGILFFVILLQIHADRFITMCTAYGSVCFLNTPAPARSEFEVFKNTAQKQQLLR